MNLPSIQSSGSGGLNRCDFAYNASPIVDGVAVEDCYLVITVCDGSIFYDVPPPITITIDGLVLTARMGIYPIGAGSRVSWSGGYPYAYPVRADFFSGLPKYSAGYIVNGLSDADGLGSPFVAPSDGLLVGYKDYTGQPGGRRLPATLWINGAVYWHFLYGFCLPVIAGNSYATNHFGYVYFVPYGF